MVNRDFVCIIWFRFIIRWGTTKDMMEGKNVIGYIMSTNVLMRETQDILSCGVLTTALEHDCGRRTAVIYCSSLLTSLLSWLRYCCEKN